ncbi:MAG TPA: hypothetical protein VGN68_04505 [Sphingopyxis sp.]|jgi:hypothetical protein|uniref:hypothetical protein n=1 Tax=Sphingopyxis sp. TaxID=1908224 RepID=UPI002E0DA488|nr:hypothetical protein [Sphingopyxis sp.]
MNDGTPTLEVGFAIDTGSSYDALLELQKIMDSTEAQIVRDAAAIERATSGMLDLGGATASMRSFGSAATREAQLAARELNRVERAGEALSRQLERDASTMGKTRAEIRAMKVDAAALAAEQQGLTELSGRLRAQEAALQAAAQQTAAAMNAEASATARAAREHAELAARVRGSQAAMEADAAAAERLRMSTDPLYAATSRLNAEIAESTRLYQVGATAPAEYARQQEVLVGRLRDVEQQHAVVNRSMGTAGATGRLAGHHMQNLAFQFQDLGVQMVAAAGSSAPLKMTFMALMQQGAQIQGIMAQAGVGIRAVGAAFLAMSRDILVAAATNPIILGIAAVIGTFAGAVKLLQNAANSSADMEEYARSLGLTAKEIRNLENVTVTWGDTAKAVFQVAGRAIWDSIGPSVSSVWSVMKEWTSWIFTGVKGAVNFMIGGFVGAYNVITKQWEAFPAAIGDVFFSAVNSAITAINQLIAKAIEGMNYVASQANRILPEALQIPQLDAPQISQVNNQYAGAYAKFGKTARAQMNKAMGVDYLGRIGGAISDQAAQNARDRIRAQAEEKGYLDPESGSNAGNDRAARLAREAEAVEAQIRNLYALADAYKVSGAAALIAEARVKAESDAIKKRGDIEEMVNRQVRLAIAERVSSAAKSTAAMREQAAIQEEANALVAAGNVTAERAAELVKDQIADLPLLAAAQAAQQRGLAEEARKAMDALADQQAERERMRQAEEAAQFNRDTGAGANRLAELREELRLIGATNAERVEALALLKATQEAEAKFSDPSRREAYIAQQIEIAAATEASAAAQRDLNDALSFTADKWDLIAQNVQNAASGLSDAFGDVGAALGDVTAIYANFRAQEERAAEIHRANMAAQTSDAGRQREIAKFQLATSTAQVGLYGDMASAAKGFFKEKSAGYKALMTAEKVFRAFEFAMSVKAIVQDIAETVSSVSNSAARATAAGAEGIAAQAKLPFPYNIAAMAATGAALVAAGIALLGGSGGGSGTAPQTNAGTGTVLGDSSAQSESIKNSIDALKEVDTLMLNYSRQMAASLRSIESQIGGFASLIVRDAGGITDGGGIAEGFKTSGIGSVLSKIPLIGGILGGLFGTKTTLLGSGLSAGAQTLGDILTSGFQAELFSTVQKKKKFLGFTTSNKTSTTFSAADPTLENQFALILREFNNAIVAAAGPLGAATTDIQQRLNGFVVNLGKIDLKGLTGAEIEEKLTAVFGAAADNMARAAFPGMERFQRAGEGLFETIVRVASVAESVTAAFTLLGQAATGMSLDAKVALADQFDSISDLSNAVDSYFSAFYTREEQAAARTAQMASVFQSLNLTMPTTLAGFRQLVEAQNLNTAAGQAAYATLLQLAPAFAELQAAMSGAKSAADIATERQDLERQLLELRGDTAALRALQLAKLDASNRALQQEIWAIQDAQAAAKAADELRKAWASVGDSIMDEVRRIRGLSDAGGGNSFAQLQGQFNAATDAARGGDMDAAKSLPGLSKALLDAASAAATSRQELDRIRAQIAASLEATNGLIGAISGSPAATNAALLNAGANSQPETLAVNDNNAEAAARFEDLRAETEQMRRDLTAALATIAANTGRVAKKMDDVTSQSGGDAIATVSAAA